MGDIRVREAGVRHLEWLFSPPGLPLVAKVGDDVRPTTAILVRGGAGTGKTTLAVALAHAIARENQGIVLYLSTEAVTRELAYKLRQLGLEGVRELAWQRRSEGEPGSFVARHLGLLDEDSQAEDEDLAETSEGRSERALRAVWALLEEHRASGDHPPIRAVIIDAFGIPERAGEGRSLRTPSITWIQALENRGITPILIEEAVPGSEDALRFVVDLVFELGFEADPDSRKLHRTLAVPKSRYVVAEIGPHDYGLEEGRPAVWPDPVPLLGARAFREHCGAIRPVVGAIPGFYTGGALVVRDGALIAGRAGPLQARVGLLAIPGVRSCSLELGAVAMMSGAAEDEQRFIDVTGPHALFWQVLATFKSRGYNLISVLRPQAVAAQVRFAVGLPRAMLSWRGLGFVVMVEDLGTAFDSLSAQADVYYRDNHQVKANFSKVRVALVRRLASRLALFERLPSPSADSLQDLDYARVNTEAIFGLAAEISSKLTSVRAQAKAIKLPNLGTAVLGLGYLRDMLLVCLGQESVRDLVEGRGLLPLWILALLGHDEKPLAELGRGEGVDLSQPDARLLWAALQAIHSPSEVALEEILRASGRERRLVFPLLVRALAVRERWQEVDDTVDRHSEELGLELTQLERLKIDARLELGGPVLAAEAASRYEKLLEESGIPTIDQADMLFNLAQAKEQLGDPRGRGWACQLLERALQRNPHLDLARTRLLALGGTPPPPPPD